MVILWSSGSSGSFAVVIEQLLTILSKRCRPFANQHSFLSEDITYAHTSCRITQLIRSAHLRNQFIPND